MAAWGTVPELLPTHADTREPVRRPLDVGRLDEAAETWANPTWIARRATPAVRANRLSGGHVHSTLHIDVGPRGAAGLELRVAELVTALATVVEPHYAIVHTLTNPERTAALEQQRPDVLLLSRKTLAVTLSPGHTKQLLHGLPAVYWQNLFGKPYIELFGESRLREAPVFQVRDIARGILLQLTEEPPTDATWSAFRRSVEDLKTFLGRDAFWPHATRVPRSFYNFELVA